MAKFGKRSKDNLDTCEEDLRAVLNEAIKYYDFSVICGHRDMEAQNKAFADGFSKARWPLSRHNSFPSLAADCIPYPEGFKATDEEFYKMALVIFSAASRLNVPIRWGGHFKSIRDLPHFELL